MEDKLNLKISFNINECDPEQAKEVVKQMLDYYQQEYEHDGNDLVISSQEDKKIFFNTLENPPAPNDKLKEAVVKYREFVEDNK